jgi:topoisomerase-4 subunit A
MSEITPPGSGDGIEPVDLRSALEERYLAYALSTIMHRALPDVRDGLKPVHRRLLYAMRMLKLDPNQGFKKCARVVGDVIGKYHPHGDQAVYDAMVRLAQDFAQRYPLVEGQGNFGNIDGDNAAAYRYTEARLTDVAMALARRHRRRHRRLPRDLQWRRQGTGRAAGRLPKPARQWRNRHRGRHGDIDTATQRR